MTPPRITSLIVDDEPIARQVLREELAEVADLEVVGEADHGEAALRQIAERRPDVVFLDLQMPDLDGFGVIARLRGDNLPIIVVVTAYDRHAMQAFDAGAIDYLLKPVSEERLAQALDKVRRLFGRPREIAERVAQIQAVARPAAPGGAVQKIVGRKGDEYFLMNADEVLAFQADGELVWILTESQRFLATQSLRGLETRLTDPPFRRVHRGAIVNINHVRKMSVLSSQRWLLTLNNGKEFIVSKRQAHAVRELLEA